MHMRLKMNKFKTKLGLDVHWNLIKKIKSELNSTQVYSTCAWQIIFFLLELFWNLFAIHLNLFMVYVQSM